MNRVDDLERTGIELSDENPLPARVADLPVSLEELRACLAEDLDIASINGRLATFDAELVSLDPEHWTGSEPYNGGSLR